MSAATQFYLLQYKNWKLQFRKKVVTTLELLIPVVLCMLMVVIRSIVVVKEYPDPQYFNTYSIDGLPPDLQASVNPSVPYMGLAYTPKTAITDQIMAGVQIQLTESDNNMTGPFIIVNGMATEDALVHVLIHSNDSVNNELFYVAGIVFDEPEAYKTAIPYNISYTIRCKYNLRTPDGVGETWEVDRVFPTLIIPGPQGDNFSSDPNYYNEGFISVQHALHKSVINVLNPDSGVMNVSTLMQRFPYPPYTDDIFLLIIQLNFPFFIMLCMIFFSLNIPKEVTLEKEQKLKESMRMMGMSNWLQWLAWFFKYFVFLLVVTFLMALLLCPPYNLPKKYSVLSEANFILIWVFFLLYAMSLVCFCFMISVFFNKANASAAAGGIIFFLSYIPWTFLSTRYDDLSRTTKLAACLDLNLAMSIGMALIGRFEGTGVGVQWSNLYETVTVDDNIYFGHVLLMFIVDCFVYILIMWYVEAVFPGTYGIPQKPYFFVLPSYWCGTKQNLAHGINGSRVSVGDEKKKPTSEYFEDEPVNMTAGIQIQNLTKKFKAKGTDKIAVNELNLNMYDGQITALLGHNGAGKTTTMFMLTGFVPPTSGTALVNGYDIRRDIANVRSSLGLCPQHDILFDNLTVEEHLYFFAKLKRCPSNKIQSEIDYYVKTLGIEEKRNAFSSTLSGGQKRKLSVGIALIGDSKIVILDEPTSGMDPSARRHMWDVLQEQRAGRTMILSTHFMDEADHLGDRIAILADGVVQCCGSSLFLKKKFGAGYHMVMTKKPDCDIDKVHEMLTKHVPEATLESSVGAELSYILPDSKVSAFPGMFAELETSKDALGILGFGASVTTMEEVFIKVGEGHATEDDDDAVELVTGIKSKDTKSNQTDNTQLDDVSEIAIAEHVETCKVTHDVTKNTGSALFAQQFRAMFVKRAIFTWRNKLLTLSQILLPLLFSILNVAIIKSTPTDDGLAQKRAINLEMYEETKSLYSIGGAMALGDNFATAFKDQFGVLPKHTVEGVANPAETILAVADESMRSYRFETIVAADYNISRNDGFDVNVIFNPLAVHGAPTALLYSDRAMLHHFVNSSYTFSAANQPLPQSANAEIQTEANDAFNFDSFAYSSNMMFGFSFLAASFVFFLITERSRKIKHSQIVSGVKWYNFWLSTFTWDFINYMIPVVNVLILFFATRIENFADVTNGNKQPGYFMLLMVLYGLAFLPQMYVLQFVFSGPATGYVVLVFFNMLTGIFPLLVVVILLAIESTRDVGRQMEWIFIILFPNYNMGNGIGNMFTNYQYQKLCFETFPVDGFDMEAGKESLDKICEQLNIFGREFPCCKDNCGDTCLDFQEDYLAWESLGIGRPLVFLGIQTFFFWLIVVAIETEIVLKLFYKIRPKILVTPEIGELKDDQDVLDEKEKILFNEEQRTSGENKVVISGLTKYFAQHKAVDDIYIAIPTGECFGLLGVNGAGKTTTFKMLTGDETISGGTAYMDGMNIRTDIHAVQKSIGYCPQFDALIDQMTGEEMLYMYARLRGIPEVAIPGIVKDLLTALLLNKHKKKLTKDYSGGNKRKLSTAIALMGDPPIVFLDEPTTGMDPVARRMLWGALTKVRESGKTLILTSHSMEECEALCTRMAIMVNGKYRCLGSTQHLKNKFGAGYTLIARVSYPADGSLPDIKAVQDFVEENFPDSVLKDKHQNLVQYHIAKGDLTWAGVFEKLESHKESLNIEDYSVSQTTLEQVFINFARAQIEPEEKKPGCLKRCRQTFCVCCIPEYVIDNHHS